jgi:Flp pilus assembly pilin Flp
MRSTITKLHSLLKREEGQTMAEYTIVLGVISVGIILALVALSGAVSDELNTIASMI